MAYEKSKIEMLSDDAKKAKRERRLLAALKKGEEEMRRLSLIGLHNGGVLGAADSYGIYDKPFLPIEKDESYEHFVYRVLYRTSLYNGTKKSINDINDRIFSTAIHFDCKDKVFEDHIKYNFDGAGSGLNEFSKILNKEALWDGCSFVLINQNGKGVRNNKNLPNALMISADDVEILRKENGKIKAFKHVYTTEEEIDEFETKKVTFRDMYFYKDGRPFLTKYKKIEEEEYTIDYEKFLDIDEIPIVELYPETDRKDLLCNRPYQDMANLNLTNWIFKSNYMTLVGVTTKSFLFASGIKETAEKIPHSIYTMFSNSNPQAKIEWVQADPKSADTVKELLKENQEEMKMLGSEFLETKATLTATEVKYSTSDTNSRAQNFAFNLEKALEKCVELMLKWHNKENLEFNIEVNKNIGLTKNEEIFDKVILLNDKGIISDKEVRETSKKVGYISADKTEEEYVEDLENEGKTLTGNNLFNINEDEEEQENLEE